MSLPEAVQAAFEALAVNKLRSTLTMLGVIIGVAAIILLIALGQGTKAYIVKELTGLGTNLLIIQPGKTETAGGFHPPLSTVRNLTYEDALTLKRRAPLLEEVVPVVIGSGMVKHRSRSRDVPVVGVTPEYQKIRRLSVEAGSFLTHEDVEAKRRVVVLGRTVKRELFGEGSPLGRMVTLAGARYRVIGMLEPKGVALGIDMDDVVFIPVRSAQELFDTDRLFEILASIASSEVLDPAVEQIKAVLTRRHSGREDFHIVSQGDMLSALKRILDILTGVLAGIAGISLLVGGIGIMNIMLVSVTERTSEIGLRKAVGARRRDILRQFLAEAVTLSFMGGAMGTIMGIGGAWLVSPLLSLPTEVPLWSILLAFAASAAVGIFFGVYPARRASLLDPIAALRRE